MLFTVSFFKTLTPTSTLPSKPPSSLVLKHMDFQGISARGPVRAMGTKIRLFSSVSSDVLLQIFLCGTAVRTVRAGKGSLSRVAADVSFHVSYDRSRILADGALVNLHRWWRGKGAVRAWPVSISSSSDLVTLPHIPNVRQATHLISDVSTCEFLSCSCERFGRNILYRQKASPQCGFWYVT